MLGGEVSDEVFRLRTEAASASASQSFYCEAEARASEASSRKAEHILLILKFLFTFYIPWNHIKKETLVKETLLKETLF